MVWLGKAMSAVTDAHIHRIRPGSVSRERPRTSPPPGIQPDADRREVHVVGQAASTVERPSLPKVRAGASQPGRVGVPEKRSLTCSPVGSLRLVSLAASSSSVIDILRTCRVGDADRLAASVPGDSWAGPRRDQAGRGALSQRTLMPDGIQDATFADRTPAGQVSAHPLRRKKGGEGS